VEKPVRNLEKDRPKKREKRTRNWLKKPKRLRSKPRTRKTEENKTSW